MKNGDVPSSEEFWAAGKQFFCGNPDGFQGKIAPSRGQKARRLGMLTFFKQALASLKALTDGKVGMAALAAVETLANQKCRVVTGRYMGTGESYQIISLGFRPKVVVVDDLQSSSASAELEPDGRDARSVIVVDRGIQVENYNREINRRNGQYRYYAFV